MFSQSAVDPHINLLHMCVTYFTRGYKIRYLYSINYNILKNLYFFQFTQTTNIC